MIFETDQLTFVAVAFVPFADVDLCDACVPDVALPGIPEWPVCGNPISKLGGILLQKAVFD
jgi:hypothetical protein